jgi:hypothetical protein
MRRTVPIVLLAAGIAVASLATTAYAGPGPEFRLGFKLMAGQIPDTVGEPIENEWHNAENGDGLQRTTRGMMVWRKADNWTAFTDGYLTWVNGPFGLQVRLNQERFGWEIAAPGDGLQPQERQRNEEQERNRIQDQQQDCDQECTPEQLRQRQQQQRQRWQ